MPIVGGLDVHRAQITYDYVDLRTGTRSAGQIRPATRAEVRRSSPHSAGRGRLRPRGHDRVALCRRGTATSRHGGPSRRAGRDTGPARSQAAGEDRPRRSALLRDLLLAGNLPESWIPPDHLADLRTTVRLRRALVAEKAAWVRRMHAQLFHHGLPIPPHLQTATGREYPATAVLPRRSPGARHRLSMLDALDAQARGSSTPSCSLSRGASTAVRCYAASGASARCSRRRSSPSSVTRDASRAHASRCASPGWTSPSRSPTASARAAISPARDHRRCAGHSMRPPAPPGGRPRPTTSTTSKPKPASALSGPGSRSLDGSCAGSTTSSPKQATTRSSTWPREPVRGDAYQSMISAGSLFAPSSRTWRDPTGTSGRTLDVNTRPPITSPGQDPST